MNGKAVDAARTAALRQTGKERQIRRDGEELSRGTEYEGRRNELLSHIDRRLSALTAARQGPDVHFIYQF